MRKFLFFILAALLSVGSGWAQTDVIKVSTNTANPEYVYVVHCACVNQSYYWSATGAPVNITDANAANAAKFAFFAGENEGDYYIYSIDDSKYVSYNKANVGNKRDFSTNVTEKAKANVWKFTAGVKNGVSYYDIQPYNSSNEVAPYYVNWNGGVDNITHTSLGLWQDKGSKDPGSTWAIVPISPDYIVFGYNYYITVNSNYEWNYYFGGATGYTSYTAYNNDISNATKFSVNYYGVNTVDASNPRMYTITDNTHHELLAYKTIGDAASSVVPLVDVNSAYSNNTTWTFKPKTITKNNNNGKTTGFVVFPSTTSSYGWNKHGGTLGLWGDYNAASVAVFVPADLEAMNDLLHVVKGLDYVLAAEPALGGWYRRSASAFLEQSEDYTEYNFETAKQLVEAYYEEPELITKTVNYTLTDGAGTTFEGTAQCVAFDHIVLTGAEGATFSNKVWTDNEDGTYNYSATISFDFPVSSANSKNYTYIGVASSNQRLLFAQSGDNGAYNVKCNNVENTISNMTNGSTKAFEWAIYPSCTNGVFTFTIQNRLAGKYINITSGGPNALCPLSDTGYGYAYDYCIGTGKGFHVPGENNFISINSLIANDQNLFVWGKSGTSHQGSNLKFFKPTNFGSLMDDMTEAYNSISSYSSYLAPSATLPVIGSGTGEYTTVAPNHDLSAYFITKEIYSTVGRVINGSEYYTALQFDIATTAMNGFVEARNGLTINQPTPGFYYIKNKGTQTYVKGEKANYPSVVSLQNEQNANAIFYIDKDKYIMAYENGAYWQNVYCLGINNVDDRGHTYKDPWEFSEGNSVGSYYLRYGTNDKYYAIASSATSTYYNENEPANDNGSWELIPVTTLPLKIGTNGWSTFSAPVKVALPAGVKAFYVKSDNQIENNALTLDDVEGNVLPANQGVIIKGTEKETIYFSIEDAAEPANLTGNQLVANVDGNKITGKENDGIYAFATYQSKTGFMKLMTTVTLGGHKCYLKLTNQAGSASFLSLLVDGDDDLTGVEGVDTEVESDGIVYDLFGRKISQPQKGSLYIRNGRKFIVK